MAKMVWDQLGGRFYEAGVDHGVLYLTDNSGVPWNGLTAVDEKLSDDSKPYYLDGVKYLDAEILGDFSVTLKAVMYPDEFEQFDGVGVFGNGLYVHDQRSKCFGLSYRTRIGNDVTGVDLGYKIHILYNLTAVSDTKGHASHSATPALSTFSWTLIGKPESTPGYRPTMYVVLDSTEMHPALLAKLEAVLYGNDNPELTNLLINPSAEVNATDGGWAGSNANIQRITTDAYSGVACWAVTTVAAGNSSLRNFSGRFTVIPGLNYTASAYFKPAFTSPIRAVRVYLDWYNSSGVRISTTSGQSMEIANEWVRATISGVAPVGAVSVQIINEIVSSVPNEIHYIDAIMATQKLEVSLYHDGDTLGAIWTGIPHISTSLRSNKPILPSFQKLLKFIEFRITDNGDGTWTIVCPDDLVVMLDSTTFQISDVNATYLDTNTYEIPT